MSNVVSLSDRRKGDDRKLFDAHRAALVELVCAFTIYSASGEDLDLERMLAAQKNFVLAYLELDDAKE